MRILIVSPIFPPDIGGPATYVPTLAKNLSKEHDVTVLVFSDNPVTDTDYNIVPIKNRGNFIVRQLAMFVELFKQARSADVIYAQGTVTVGFASLLVSKLFNKELVIKFVGDEVWENYRRTSTASISLEEFTKQSRLRLDTLIHRLVLRSSSRIITPSNYLKNFLVKYHSVNPQKIKVIHNPVAIPELPPLKKKNQLIYVGRLVPWKNVDLVLESFALLPSKLKTKLLIVGSGSQMGQLKKLTQTLKIDTKVEFTDKLSKAKTLRLIKQSKALVLLSDYEGQSHVLIEALSLGTQVVASDIAPNRELLKDKGTLVPFDKQSIAKALASPKVYRFDMQIFKQEHSWENHILELEKALL